MMPGPEWFTDPKFWSSAQWGGKLDFAVPPGGGAVAAGSVQYSKSKQLIKVEHLVMPVTMVIQYEAIPNLPGIFLQTSWGSGGTVTTYNLNPGIHIVHGSSLEAQLNVQPGPITQSLVFRAFASICFTHPQWDGELVPPEVGT